MDKSTLSNYGWIVITCLVLAVMIALATPFGKFIEAGVQSTYQGLLATQNSAFEKTGLPSQASCGISGHFTNDGKIHDLLPEEDDKGHKYACECNSFVIPEGGTYTLATPVNGKSVFNSVHRISNS